LPEVNVDSRVSTTNWPSFAHIAAQADLARLCGRQGR